MADLWSVFRHGNWPYDNTIKPKRSASVRENRSGDTIVLYAPKSNSTISIDFFGQGLWELCDGSRTVGDIYQELCHRYKYPELHLVVDLTKNLLHFYELGVIELSRSEKKDLGKTRTIDLRNITFYVINCSDDHKKRDFIQNQLLEKGLTFNFINGVQCSPKYVGVALSHLKTLRLPEIKAPFAIVEDDCQFTNAFRYQYEVPDTTDALYLGVSLFGTKSPGKFSGGVWKNTQYRQYNEQYLRVFNMLARHAIVYLSEGFCQSAIEASLQALTHPDGPYPGDIGYALLQTSHLVLTPNDPICYQGENHNENHPATKYPLRVLKRGNTSFNKD